MIYIVGGGVIGVSIANELIKAGLAFEFHEATSDVGGLAAPILIDGEFIDKYYHFYYDGDSQCAEFLLRDLDPEYVIRWSHIKTESYNNGNFVSSDSFTALCKRYRMGALKILWALLTLKLTTPKKKLDSISAEIWCKKKFGTDFNNDVWLPLLQGKFGSRSTDISAYWLATRIRRHLSTKKLNGKSRFGYLVGTYSNLFNSFKIKAEKNGASVYINSKLIQIVRDEKNITEIIFGERRIPIMANDIVITTFPFGILKNIQGLNLNYLSPFGVIPGAVVVLRLRNKLSDAYWTTVTDPNVPFDAIIQQARLYKNSQYEVVYLSKYNKDLDSNTKDIFAQESIDSLRIMYPSFRNEDIVDFFVFSSPAAAPVPITKSLDIMPNFRSPLRNLYHCSFDQIYPEDRGVGNSARIGRKLAELVISATNEKS